MPHFDPNDKQVIHDAIEGALQQGFDAGKFFGELSVNPSDKQEAVAKVLVINGEIAEYEYVGNLSDGEYLLYTSGPLLTDAQHATLLSCALRFEAEGNKPMANDIRALLAAPLAEQDRIDILKGSSK